METTIYYNEHNINVRLYQDNTHIENSYRIKRRKDMRNVLELIRMQTDGNNIAINRFGLKSMIREWRAHNLLYVLGVARERTRSVDLNDEGVLRKIAYFILSLMYWKR